MTLCRSLIDLGLDLNSPEATVHALDIFRYLSGVDTAFDFQHKFKKVCAPDTNPSAKDFRMSFSRKAYFCLYLKYAFISASLSPRLTPEIMGNIQQDFNIDRNDMVMLKRVLLMRGVRSAVKAKGYKSHEVTRMRMEADKIVYREMLPEIQKVVGSITYKRMRFISTSTNTDFSDLNNTLQCKALSTFYSLMPIRTTLAHVKNYVMRALNNEAVNMIAESTSEKRGRLVQGAKDGYGGNNYELVVVSNNQIKAGVDGEISYDDLGNDGSDITETLDFDRLVRRYGDAPNRKAFLMLVTGHEDQMFTDYLNRQRCLRNGEDSVDYYNRVEFPEYHAHINAFLGIDSDLSKAFLGFLGKALGK
jgi:hypothetical protein